MTWMQKIKLMSSSLRLVSCGNDNIRFWRIRHGSLRSCPVDLGRHGSVNFTDVAYGAKDPLSADPTVRKV